MGALAVAIAWRWALASLNAPGATTFAWAAIALTAPYLINTFTVYPEIAAGLAVIVRLFSRNRATPTARPRPVDRVGPRDRLAAVAEHEVRADVGRPPAHRDLPSR